jgi:hypothetical protein
VAPLAIVGVCFGAPWRVEINACASNIVAAFVVELLFTAGCRHPPAAVILLRNRGFVRSAGSVTVAPTCTLRLFLLRLLKVVLTPRSVVLQIYEGTAHILDTLPHELWRACLWCLPAAFVFLGLGSATRASKLAVLVGPRLSLFHKMPGRIFIGGVEAILAWNIALECCPSFVFNLGRVINQQRHHRMLWISDDKGKLLPLVLASGGTRLAKFGEEPASSLGFSSIAGRIIEVLFGHWLLLLCESALSEALLQQGAFRADGGVPSASALLLACVCG